jgi:hypothetical protein
MPIDAHAIARAVVACPDVAALSGGVVSEVATYLPGERVVGVRETLDGVEIRIAARWGLPIPLIAEQVRTAVRPLVGAASVLVVVDDLELQPARASVRPLSV